jgi:hypothetical protein
VTIWRYADSIMLGSLSNWVLASSNPGQPRPASLRTSMARLNGYLYRINVVETDQCACGQARETVEHFLFRCRKWTAHRTEMLQCTNTHRGNISFFLGGKSPSDDQNWTLPPTALLTQFMDPQCSPLLSIFMSFAIHRFPFLMQIHIHLVCPLSIASRQYS